VSVGEAIAIGVAKLFSATVSDVDFATRSDMAYARGSRFGPAATETVNVKRCRRISPTRTVQI
jgi:hypothetical protein